MRILFSLILFCVFVSVAAYSEQGTMSTDQTPASEAPASMSGTTNEEIDLDEDIETREKQEEKDRLLNVEDERLNELEEEVKD